jgi:hypothetical protein
VLLSRVGAVGHVDCPEAIEGNLPVDFSEARRVLLYEPTAVDLIDLSGQARTVEITAQASRLVGAFLIFLSRPAPGARSGVPHSVTRSA